MLDEYCSHRRASLLYARNEECGLRCLYHGWKFDVDGNVVEMASEPAESNIPQRVKHKAYPAREAGGFVWCYMGPADEMPAFEPPAFAPTPDARVSAHEGARALQLGADPRRRRSTRRIQSSLHSSDMVPAQVEGAKATDDELAAAVDRQGAALPDRAHQPTASATRRSAARSRTRRRTTTSAPPSTSRRSPR